MRKYLNVVFMNVKGLLVLRGGFACCVLLLTTLSCQDSTPKPNPCMTGDCDAQMYLPGEKDDNGYYHIQLDWTTEFMPYFFIEVLAAEVIPEYRYNGVSHVSAEFDTDTFWTLGGLVWREPLYNPFKSNQTSSGTWLPSEITYLTIDYFKGMTLNLVQPVEVYFSKKHGNFYTKRSIGPVPPQLIGDTVTVYMEMFWDAGNASVLKDHYKEKFIIE